MGHLQPYNNTVCFKLIVNLAVDGDFVRCFKNECLQCLVRIQIVAKDLWVRGSVEISSRFILAAEIMGYTSEVKEAL